MRENILNSRPERITAVKDPSHESILEIEWKHGETCPTSEENEFPLSKVSRFSAAWLLEHSLDRSDQDDRRFSELRIIEGLTADKFSDQKLNRPIDFSKIISAE